MQTNHGLDGIKHEVAEDKHRSQHYGDENAHPGSRAEGAYTVVDVSRESEANLAVLALPNCAPCLDLKLSAEVER